MVCFWRQLSLIWFTLAMVSALGQNNVFGVFRKRCRSLEKIQDKRVEVASRKGFAGPNGERLSVEDARALQQKTKENVIRRIRRALLG